MGQLFSKSKSPKKKQDLITEQDKAVLQLKQMRDKLKQYKKRINIQLEKEREIARELVKTNQKDKALLLLKKKRYMEGVLDRVEGEISNLEQMAMEIENKQIEIQVIEGLRIGNQALEQLNSILSIEQIEEILEETKEGIEKQNEIDARLHEFNIEFNESDLEDELEQMFKPVSEEENEQVELPNVPQEELPVPVPVKEKSQKTREKVLAN